MASWVFNGGGLFWGMRNFFSDNACYDRRITYKGILTTIWPFFFFFLQPEMVGKNRFLFFQIFFFFLVYLGHVGSAQIGVAHSVLLQISVWMGFTGPQAKNFAGGGNGVPFFGVSRVECRVY